MEKIRTKNGTVHRVQRFAIQGKEPERRNQFWCWCNHTYPGEPVSSETQTTCQRCLKVEKGKG